MKNITKIISQIAQIFAYLLAVVIIIQILKIIFGGSWKIEDAILALLILNLTLTFALGGYLINLSSKISSVDKKIAGHIEWHRGKDEN